MIENFRLVDFGDKKLSIAHFQQLNFFFNDWNFYLFNLTIEKFPSLKKMLTFGNG
jgi:hypothetical protein